MSHTDPSTVLNTLTTNYNTLQSHLQTLITARQKLESQHSENEAVRREFDILGQEDPAEERNIYKMVGPVLVKQEKVEAEEAVKGRLGWIRGEMNRVEREIADKEAESEKMKMEIYNLQSQLQQQLQQQQPAQAQA